MGVEINLDRSYFKTIEAQGETCSEFEYVLKELLVSVSYDFDLSDVSEFTFYSGDDTLTVCFYDGEQLEVQII